MARFASSGTDRAIAYEELARLPSAPPTGAKARRFRAAGCDLSERHACLRGRDRSRQRRADVARYTVCDDFGVTLNPLLLEGQVHGGVTQGIGQALHERTMFSPRRPARHRDLHGLCAPARRRLPEFCVRDAQRAVDDEPARVKGRGRSGLDRRRAGGHECRRRRARDAPTGSRISICRRRSAWVRAVIAAAKEKQAA